LEYLKKEKETVFVFILTGMNNKKKREERITHLPRAYNTDNRQTNRRNTVSTWK